MMVSPVKKKSEFYVESGLSKSPLDVNFLFIEMCATSVSVDAGYY